MYSTPFFNSTKEVDDFLVDVCDYKEETVKSWDNDSKFRAILEWEGIIGYEEYIKNWCKILKIG